MVDFESDSTVEIPDDAALRRIADLADIQMKIEDEVEEMELRLAKRKVDLAEISATKLPEALDEAGVSELALAGGGRLQIKPFVSASMPKLHSDKPEERARATLAFAWIREHDYDDLIKHFVSVTFVRGEEEQAAKAVAAFRKMGIEPKDELTIHHMTLKAQIRSWIEDGVPVPLELFNAFLGRKVKITRP